MHGVPEQEGAEAGKETGRRVVAASRRSVLKLAGGGALACLFNGAGLAASQRVVALDWGAAETMIAMASPPAGLAERDAYNKVVADAQCARLETVDVGLRLAPNAEALYALKPSLIVINSAQAYMRSSLERFAPVHTFTIYGTEDEPLAMAEQATSLLGTAMAAQEQAAELRGTTAAALQQLRRSLAGKTQRPVFVVQLQDEHHAAVFGKGSLVQGVLDRIGISNAWTGKADFWGLSVVGLEAFAAVPEAILVYFALPQVDVASIRSGFFWQNLPQVRARRAVSLPSLWAYGGLPSATRIAAAIAAAVDR